jgi:hypothetical protein
MKTSMYTSVAESANNNNKGGYDETDLISGRNTKKETVS